MKKQLFVLACLLAFRGSWREALERCARDPEHYEVAPDWMSALGKVSEGQHQTLGAYSRPWK